LWLGAIGSWLEIGLLISSVWYASRLRCAELTSSGLLSAYCSIPSGGDIKGAGSIRSLLLLSVFGSMGCASRRRGRSWATVLCALGRIWSLFAVLLGRILAVAFVGCSHVKLGLGVRDCG